MKNAMDERVSWAEIGVLAWVTQADGTYSAHAGGNWATIPRLQAMKCPLQVWSYRPEE